MLFLLIDERQRDGKRFSSLEYHTAHDSRLKIFLISLFGDVSVSAFFQRFFSLSVFNFTSRPSDDASAWTRGEPFQCHEQHGLFWEWTKMIFLSLPADVYLFAAHRSHRRCLITESMMKTNCCVYRNVLRSAVLCRCRPVVLVNTENVVKNSSSASM